MQARILSQPLTLESLACSLDVNWDLIDHNLFWRGDVSEESLFPTSGIPEVGSRVPFDSSFG